MDAPWPPTWPKMAEELHVFDPKGDVLLILGRHPEQDLVNFVEEDNIEEHSSSRGSARPLEVDSLPEEPPPADEEAVPVSEPELPEPYEVEAGEPGAESEIQNNLARLESPASSVSFALWRQKQNPEVQMRVSSKHLILASPTFCTSLDSDTFPEGRTLQTEGSVVVPLPDEDPDAMIILMHIIHGQTSKVPRYVSLETLSKLAGVVNHRQMHDAVEFFSDTWIEKLKPTVNELPSSHTTMVLEWLFIVWVFQKEDEFRKVSQVLQRESDDTLEDEVDEDPPIPASIISAIQDIRIEGIEGMMEFIHDLITKYSGPETVCQNNSGFACDAILLGSLLKRSASFGIWPQPKDPYPGITFKTLADQIRGMQVLDDCSQSGRGGGFYNAVRDHGIKDSIEASIRSLEDRMCGLSLGSFLPKRDIKIRSKWGFS